MINFLQARKTVVALRLPSSRLFTLLLTNIILFSVVIACDNSDPDNSEPQELDMEVMSDMMDMMTQSTIDDRCPNARAGVQILVMYNDRVEAFAQDEVGFKVTKSCTFIAQAEQGANNATAMAIGPEGRVFITAPEGEAGGSVYVYSNNGEFEKKVGPNINLKDVSRIWRINGGFVVWISRNASLYKIDAEGEFVGVYTPPEQGSSRLQNLSDMEYIGDDEEGRPRILALFSDRAPQLFAFPNSPILEGMVSANAVSLVETSVGKKPLMTGVIEGTTRGVGQFRHVTSGRMAPAYESTLVYETDDGYGDGKDIANFEDGFYILDSGNDGERSPSLNSFNTSGIPQEKNSLGSDDIPLEITRTLIFGDF